MNTIKVFLRRMCISALAIVSSASNANLFAQSSASPLLEHAKLEKKAFAEITAFAKKYQGGRFGFISVGSLTSELDTDSFGLWVTGKTKETIESGRALAVAFIQAYVKELQTNKDITAYYELQCKKWPDLFSGQIGLKNILVRIAFWDEDVERPQVPYLAEIDFRHGKFQYYQADPKTQSLQLVLEESYDDAIARNSKMA